MRQSFVDAVGSWDISLRKLTRGLFEKEDIVEGMDGRRESETLTAASAAYLNTPLQATPFSLRSSCRSGFQARLSASVRLQRKDAGWQEADVRR